MLATREISFPEAILILSSVPSKFALDSQEYLRLPFPASDANGCLPLGIYDSTLDELADQFASAMRQFTYAYLAGRFVTRKPAPLDIKLAPETRHPMAPLLSRSWSLFSLMGSMRFFVISPSICIFFCARTFLIPFGIVAISFRHFGLMRLPTSVSHRELAEKSFG